MSKITFQKIMWRNFLSTGNTPTEITLDNSHTTLVIGENGAGKSTILDALAFGLYGKSFRRVNKPQLINSINNKRMEVAVYFNVGNKDYSIVRGMKPNIFEIYEKTNGEYSLLNQPSTTKDYQSILEKDILKLNFKSFSQIVILGSASFVPFMQLPAAHRREVIEDLLDLQIFTKMGDLLKERIIENRDSLREIDFNIKLCEEKIKNANELNRVMIQNNEEQKKSIEEKIKKEKILIGGLEEELKIKDDFKQELMSSISDEKYVAEKQYELEQIVNVLEQRIKRYKDDIKFYHDNDSCPTCSQRINLNHKHDMSTVIEEKIEKNNEDLHTLLGKGVKYDDRLTRIQSVKTEISTVENLMMDLNMKKNLISNTIMGLNADIKKLDKTNDGIVDFNILEKLRKELGDLKKDKGVELTTKEVNNLVMPLLKDGGIKTQTIKQFIPVMNKLINKYLADMDFFVQFELDEQFNETIKSRFRDEFSYESFSEGERMRINLALLFTWRTVSKLRNSISTNLLIMDEIFDGSLDSSGVEEFMKILNTIVSDSNVFVISHNTDQLVDNFNEVIRFEKKKNFSQIAA